ncbi:Putative sodium-dependent multivitamin transporter [Eumeta japonica]|uniref:Sodium-dependent multivitamin transporter n=1 Tax=Eumeta variegata TaxID=151549 RepID=A0A4C1XU93_EUMVA|nr:Putative sodium-dependent multivitamin transporter [Eumeta japonica]
MERQGFEIWDWIIIVLTMGLSMGIGIYFRFTGGKQKTNEEYLLADRNMSILPVAASLMASFISATSLLGISAENYYYGAIWMIVNIAYGIAIPIITNLYLPVFFGLQKTSTYEYLELRFGPRIRMIASLTYTLQMVLYNGIVLYAPAIVVEAITGLNRSVSILMVGLGCTIYSTLGGMKAVLFTDLLQTVLMYISIIGILIHGTIKVGGFQNVFSIASEGGRLNFINFNPDPTERHTWWSILIGGIFTHVAITGVNHTSVQRFLTVSTLKRSRMCVWMSWPLLSFLSLIACLNGLILYAVYHKCDPLTAGEIAKTDQLIPFYVVDMMKDVPGLLGLFVAGIFSASLSTVSAACNALAAVTLTDYIGRHVPTISITVMDVLVVGCRHFKILGKLYSKFLRLYPFVNKCVRACVRACMHEWCKVRETMLPWLTKFVACSYGLLFLALAFVVEHLGGLLQAALTIFGAVGGPLLGVFTLGMFTTFANEIGASVGLFFSMTFMLWISFGQPRPIPQKLPLSVEGCVNITLPSPAMSSPSDIPYLYRISYMWASPIGCLLVIVIGSLVSLLSIRFSRKPKAAPLDPALFTPLLAERLRQRRKQEEKFNVQVIQLVEKETLQTRK